MPKTHDRGPGMTQVTVALSAQMLDTIGQLARGGYRSRNQQIVMMLETYLRQAESVARQSSGAQIAAEGRAGYSVEPKSKEP